MLLLFSAFAQKNAKAAINKLDFCKIIPRKSAFVNGFRPSSPASESFLLISLRAGNVPSAQIPVRPRKPSSPRANPRPSQTAHFPHKPRYRFFLIRIRRTIFFRPPSARAHTSARADTKAARSRRAPPLPACTVPPAARTALPAALSRGFIPRGATLRRAPESRPLRCRRYISRR